MNVDRVKTILGEVFEMALERELFVELNSFYHGKGFLALVYVPKIGYYEQEAANRGFSLPDNFASIMTIDYRVVKIRNGQIVQVIEEDEVKYMSSSNEESEANELVLTADEKVSEPERVKFAANKYWEFLKKYLQVEKAKFIERTPVSGCLDARGVEYLTCVIKFK
ncbi:MAG: hypothetical protein IJR52_07620 [Selenomonadaceae bacterium]|nr:hypothetical protein [Selenomonadaceae bacterium]MBQ9497421.1 hypothetical protein [Selenomonadaceae bacterium]